MLRLEQKNPIDGPRPTNLPAMARYIFPEWTQRFLPLVGILLLGGPVYLVTLTYCGESAEAVRIGYRPHQPVPYSHARHAGELGIDCRYCHNTVEVTARAAVPPAATCMNCHTNILPQDPRLAPVRDAVAKGTPIRWVRVHDLPDYVYFNHSAHVTRGVGCESCHGRIDKMAEVYQAGALTMSWCLDCHRAPDENLREPDQVTVMGYQPPAGTGQGKTETRAEHGRALRERNKINPPTSCSTCHR